MPATFIVEDGTGLTDSNSLCDVAYADQFHLNNGNPTAWSSLDTAGKQDKLRQATQFSEANFVRRWQGRRVRQDQALSWPRYGIYDRDEWLIQTNVIPNRLKDAHALLALYAAQGDTLMPNVDAGSNIAAESASVGNGAVTSSTTYTGEKSPFKRYTLVERILREFIDSGYTIERA